MKVLYAYRQGVTGGVCTQLYHRARSLSKLGVEVSVFLRKDHGAASFLSQVCRVHIGEPKDFRKLLKQKNHDLSVIIDTPEFINMAAQVNLPFAIDVHTTYEGGLSYLRNPPACDHWMAPSKYLRQRLEGFGIPKGKITVVPNIVDGALFRPHSVERWPHPIVSWVGKLDSHKRWDAFLALAAGLAPNHPEAEFWMFGGETASDQVVRAVLDAAHMLELMPQFRWFPRVRYEAMPQVHSLVAASGGLTVVTSKDESFGMSVAEALLCGCPAVVPRVGALPELAPPSSFFQCYTPSSLEEGAGCVEKVLASPQAKDELTATRELLQTRWSPEAVAAQQKAALLRIVGG